MHTGAYTQPVIASAWTGRVIIPADIANKIVDGLSTRLSETSERWTLPDGSVVPGFALTWVVYILRRELRISNISNSTEDIVKALGFRVIYNARNRRNQRGTCVTFAK